MTEEPSNCLAPVSVEFDDIVFQLQRFGGISEYWREMTGRVAEMSGFHVHHRQGSRWGRMRRPRSRCQVYHSSYYRTARGSGVRNVTTVHDLAYELGCVGSGFKARLHRLEHKRAFFSSDALVCISENTRRDLQTVYPSLASRCEIVVIPHGVVRLPPASDSRSRAALAIAGRPFVLFVGGRDAYKNFTKAIEGFAASGLPGQGFLLACTGAALSESEQARISQHNLPGRVLSLGNVSRSELSYLYECAHCLLYPSLFEGFGLPILEAMAGGCPVIAARTSAIPEVAGNAALLVDGHDPGAIASALSSLQDSKLRLRLVALGEARAMQFSWDRSANAHAELYLHLARMP